MMLKLRTTSLFHLINKTLVTDREGKIVDLEHSLTKLVHILVRMREKKGSLFIIGNGGSAGIASHFSIDLLNVMKISAHTLYDSNQLTCLSNDYGYENSFSKPLSVHLQEGDGVVAISSSGKSPNIVQAASLAKEKGAFLCTLSGFSENNPLRSLGDYNLWLDAEDYGLVEMGHFCLLHTIIDIYALKEKKEEVVKEKVM